MPVQPKIKPLLVGIIVDISGSMAKSWNNRDSDGLPRIQSVRAVIDDQIRNFTTVHGLSRKRNTDIFCLGLGFKRPAHIEENLVFSYRPYWQSNKDSARQVDLVCDLLALSEIIPTSLELQEIEIELNRKWNDYARHSLKSTNIKDDVYDKLRDCISNSLFTSANENLQRSWFYRLHVHYLRKEANLKNPFQRWPHTSIGRFIEKRRKRIETHSIREGKRYFNKIKQRSDEIFQKSKTEYEKYIDDCLNKFIAAQSEIILNLVAVGHKFDAVIGYFEEQHANDLARSIYVHLDGDVRKKIRSTWLTNKMRLLIMALDLRGKIHFKEVDELTELCIQKYGWSVLEPFVRGVVYDLFKKSFKEQITRLMPYWIGISSGREVTRSLGQITKAFPDVYEQDFYSDQFIFGSTPMEEALYKASMRFLEPSHKNKEKVLIIISDGEFETDKPILISQGLKQSGVRVVGCCVADKDIIRSYTSTSQKSWPEGAKMIFEMSSIVNTNDVLVGHLRDRGLKIPEGIKTFYQINQSEALKDILGAVLNESYT